MRGLVQRVAEASVAVDGEAVGAIGPGLCLLVGVTHGDGPAEAATLADKVFHLRVLDDGTGRPNRSLADAAEPAVLVISQFTLYADTSRGRRPSWLAAAPGPVAEPLVDAVAHRLRDLGATVATGHFGAHMLVTIRNDGPITLMLEV